MCISTSDIATKEITSDLLNALDRGSQIVNTFIDKRLTEHAVDSVFFTCPRLKLKTFKDLKSTQAHKSKSVKTIKAHSSKVIGFDFRWTAGGTANVI